MIEKIIYDKDDGTVKIKDIGIGRSFIWNGEYVCKRISYNGSYEVYDMGKHSIADGIPAIVISSGELCVFKVDAMVEPCVVEHHVVG